MTYSDDNSSVHCKSVHLISGDIKTVSELFIFIDFIMQINLKRMHLFVFYFKKQTSFVGILNISSSKLVVAVVAVVSVVSNSNGSTLNYISTILKF